MLGVGGDDIRIGILDSREKDSYGARGHGQHTEC